MGEFPGAAASEIRGMRNFAVLLVVAVSAVAVSAAAAGAPYTLVREGTISYSVAAAYQSRIQVDEAENVVPLVDKRFGFKVITNKPDKKPYKLVWRVTCTKAGKSVTRSGVIKHRAPYTFWKPVTIPGADTCTVAVLATRYSKVGRMVAAILADHPAA
jgi:hypothetical protein